MKITTFLINAIGCLFFILPFIIPATANADPIYQWWQCPYIVTYSRVLETQTIRPLGGCSIKQDLNLVSLPGGRGYWVGSYQRKLRLQDTLQENQFDQCTQNLISSKTVAGQEYDLVREYVLTNPADGSSGGWSFSGAPMIEDEARAAMRAALVRCQSSQ